VTAEAHAPREPAPALEVPAEPAELRATIAREVLGGADWEERFGAGLGVGDALWTSWGRVLEASGMDRASFEAVVRAYRRELWFWVLGERLWEQAASGLAGRLVRRLPTG
jgi:hypothetical protein